jgi:hypothetical protein
MITPGAKKALGRAIAYGTTRIPSFYNFFEKPIVPSFFHRKIKSCKYEFLIRYNYQMRDFHVQIWGDSYIKKILIIIYKRILWQKTNL